MGLRPSCTADWPLTHPGCSRALHQVAVTVRDSAECRRERSTSSGRPAAWSQIGGRQGRLLEHALRAFQYGIDLRVEGHPGAVVRVRCDVVPDVLTRFLDASVGGALGVPEVLGDLPERVTLHRRHQRLPQ